MSLTEALVIAQIRANVAEACVREMEEELDKWREGNVGWVKTVAHLENWMKMYPVSIFPDEPPASGGDSGPEFVRAIRAALKRLAERNAMKENP